MTSVWIDGTRFDLTPGALLGQGGEAEVYDLGDGRVLKWWKPPTHPDFAGLPDAQAAAVRRLAEAPARLRALPRLPAAVIGPCGIAHATKRATELAGYLMPKVTGTPLISYGEPRWRRDHVIDGADVVAMLLALHDAIAALHRAGIVIGDCNDLNVLVDGRRVHLIDVDSYQLPGFPCAMFSERFVDPRLCDPAQSAAVPVRPHDEASDWFAFAVMAFRSLLGVGPWGGVHAPADPALRCPPVARAQRRISVLGPDIVYPRAARALATLPDECLHAFRAIFERDERTPQLRTQLERLHLRRCSTCGEEHARVRCPACQTAAMLPPAIVHGKLRWTQIPRADVVLATLAVGATGAIWIEAGALWRRGRLGPERIGAVLSNQTRAWVGARLGVGFYRAGGYAVGFVFRPDRGVLDDRVALPKIRGQLIDAGAIIGDDRAWLWLTCADRGRLVTTLVVIGADASVLAHQLVDASEPQGEPVPLGCAPWAAGLAGACAAGPHLFVPTDDGVARIELVQGVITQTRTFAETAALVGAGDRLALCAGGLDAIRQRDAIRLLVS